RRNAFGQGRMWRQATGVPGGLSGRTSGSAARSAVASVGRQGLRRAVSPCATLSVEACGVSVSSRRVKLVVPRQKLNFLWKLWAIALNNGS
ncbi:hypothetical protein, partial [Brasilonema octagenarum]|uniref:hypothetical protein n=1 Tax=Brasilonema octagenarum TaxID=417105 RepID=UPI001B7D1721